MAFKIDAGSAGGGGGPFVNWQARESTDGAIPGRNFVLRGQDGRVIVTDKFKAGVVFDIQTLKTGWQESSGQAGVAPKWVWSESIERFAPKPAGDDYKQGWSCRVALGKDQVATFEQASAAIMSTLREIGAQLSTAEAQGFIAAGKLPVLALGDIEKVETSRGVTFVPKLEIKKWISRPDILKSGTIATAPEEKKPEAKAAPKVEAKAAADDAEF